MTQTSINYAKVLYGLSVDKASVEETYRCVDSVPELLKVLVSPVDKKEEKHRVIDRVFPADMKNFIKTVCDNQDADLLKEICEAYHMYSNQMAGILSATLYYVTKPEETQLEKIKASLCRRYHKKTAELQMKEDRSLIGGFVIRIGDRELDWSLKGRMMQLERRLQN